MVSALQKNSRKPLLLVWLGSADTPQVRALFNQRKTLHFKQPESAIQALAQLNLYHHHNQQRHQTQPPHNYTPAAHAADELHKHIRPFIPVAILPATRMGSNALLAALNLTHSHDTPVLQLTWARQEPIGQTLTLATAHHSTSLLPPIQPTALAHALTQLQLPPEHWQDWLLNTSEILARLPEIHDLTLHLASPSHHHSIKLNLQDPNSFSGCPNILAPIPTAQHTLALRNGDTAILRSVRSEDATLIQQLIQAQSEHSRYTRFMSKANEIPPALLAGLASPDYHRDHALILHTNSPTPTPLAHANYIADPIPTSCEFGIIIDDSLQGQGIGYQLMTHLITHAKAQGHTLMRAEILADNHPMQKLALKLGFTLNKHPHDSGLVEAKLYLV